MTGSSKTSKTWQDLFEQGLVATTASAEIRRLLVAASGLELDELLKVWNEPASLRAAAQFEQMLQSRQTGKPLQYILGSWGFRSLDLYLDERVLIPRPETEHLVEVASQELSRRRDSRFGQVGFDGDGSRFDESRSHESHSGESPRRLRVADMGCGSGAIGLSIAAEHTDVEVFCCDLSSDALAVTRANLAGLGMAASPVYIAQGHWYQGLKQATLLAAASSTHKFDLICSNPPYIANSEVLPASVRDFEPVEALYAGEKGTEAIAELLEGAAGWLLDGGAFVCEIAPSQADSAISLASENGLVDVAITNDLAGRQRILRARKPQAAAPPAD